MTLYSTSTRQPDGRGPAGTKHISFKARFKVLPDQAFGRRMEYVRDLEKIAQFAEEELIENEDSSTSVTFKIARPVAYKPQIGQVPAHIEIYGFVNNDDTPNDPPLTPLSLIHSGTAPGEKTSVIEGTASGDISTGQEPKSQFEMRAAEIRDTLENILSTIDKIENIFFLEVSGVKFGSMPNQKAFRSLPTL